MWTITIRWKNGKIDKRSISLPGAEKYTDLIIQETIAAALSDLVSQFGQEEDIIDIKIFKGMIN
jgi:hypothetical protein